MQFCIVMAIHKVNVHLHVQILHPNVFDGAPWHVHEVFLDQQIAHGGDKGAGSKPAGGAAEQFTCKNSSIYSKFLPESKNQSAMAEVLCFCRRTVNLIAS